MLSRVCDAVCSQLDTCITRLCLVHTSHGYDVRCPWTLFAVLVVGSAIFNGC